MYFMAIISTVGRMAWTSAFIASPLPLWAAETSDSISVFFVADIIFLPYD